MFPLNRTENKLLDGTMTFGPLLLTRAMIAPMLLHFFSITFMVLFPQRIEHLIERVSPRGELL